MSAIAIVEGLATPSHLQFAARMVIEATTPPFTQSFWQHIAAEARVDAVDLVTTAFSMNAYAWGSPSDFVIVLQGDLPVASCSGHGALAGAAAAPLRRGALALILRSMAVPGIRLQQAVAAFDTIWPEVAASPFAIAPAPWIIENVGVDPDFRGQGLLTHLINAVTAKGERRGHRVAGLSVVQGNDRAVNAYLRLGFEISATYGPRDFGGEAFPGLIKMRKILRSHGDQQAPEDQAPCP